MEIFELKYFLAVARVENVNRAAAEIHVSPGSLSKAVARLEEELQTPLFFKAGRGIRLTPEGLRLKERAAQIVQMEEDARLELTGKEMGSLNLYVSSEEILQAAFGVEVSRLVGSEYPQARTRFLVRDEAAAIDQVISGEAHLAFITSEPPAQVVSKVLRKVEFRTCASKAHPLLKKYSGRQAIPVEDVLQSPFVSPEAAILGRISKASTLDGWRDDKFPRKIKYRAASLKLMETLIQEGLALGYLPDYFVESSGLIPLKVSGCPYSCQQTVRVIAKDPSALGWLQKIWSRL